MAVTDVLAKQVKANHFTVTVIFAYDYAKHRKVNSYRIGVFTHDNQFFECYEKLDTCLQAYEAICKSIEAQPTDVLNLRHVIDPLAPSIQEFPLWTIRIPLVSIRRTILNLR